jgi:hypothetical protein
MVHARGVPHIGAEVTVIYLAARSRGVVAEVLDGGRRLVVLTEEGDTLTFALARTTGRFIADSPELARLTFGHDDG